MLNFNHQGEGRWLVTSRRGAKIAEAQVRTGIVFITPINELMSSCVIETLAVGLRMSMEIYNDVFEYAHTRALCV